MAGRSKQRLDPSMGKLLLLFTAVPVLEFYLLFQIAGRFGFLTTLALVIITGALGAALAKTEGLRLLRDWQVALSQGRMPEDGVVHGALLLVGGVLLVTPGVLTDITGLLLLLPQTRGLIAAFMRRELERRIANGEIVFHSATADFGSGVPLYDYEGQPLSGRDMREEDIIEGSFEVVGEQEEETANEPARPIH